MWQRCKTETATLRGRIFVQEKIFYSDRSLIVFYCQGSIKSVKLNNKAFK